MTPITVPHPSKNHNVKKITLLVVTALEALHIIYSMVKAETIAGEVLGSMKLHRNTAEDQKTLAVTISILGGLGLALHFLMTMGVLLRHICIVTTMVVIHTLGVFSSVLNIFIMLVGVHAGDNSALDEYLRGKSYLNAFIGTVFAALLYLYLRDIRQIRDEERRRAYQGVKHEEAA